MTTDNLGARPTNETRTPEQSGAATGDGAVNSKERAPISPDGCVMIPKSDLVFLIGELDRAADAIYAEIVCFGGGGAFTPRGKAFGRARDTAASFRTKYLKP